MVSYFFCSPSSDTHEELSSALATSSLAETAEGANKKSTLGAKKVGGGLGKSLGAKKTTGGLGAKKVVKNFDEVETKVQPTTSSKIKERRNSK